MKSQKGLAPILIVLLIAAATFGYLLYSGKINLNQTTTQVAQPSQTPDETANPDSIGANWKIYSFNNEFSFKYPTNWQAGDLEATCCSFVANPSSDYSANSEGTLHIEGVYNQENCIEGSFERLSGNLNAKESKMNFAGQQARVFESESEIGVDQNLPLGYNKKIILAKDDACYTITYLSATSNTEQRKIFEQILSTFKFTN